MSEDGAVTPERGARSTLAQGLTALGEGVAIAMDALRSNMIRTGLTILGVAIGVGVVVTMAALITGIRSSVMEAFEAAGPDNFTVMPFDFTEVRLTSNRPPWWDRPEITNDEIFRIAALPAVKEAVVAFDFNVSMAFEGERVSSVSAAARSAGWPAYILGDFVAGRNFVEAEVRHSRPVAVLSGALAEEIFGQRDPVGRRIRVARQGVMEIFEVVGVFQPEENVFGSATQHFAVFPWSSAERRLNARDRFNFMSVMVVPDSAMGRVEAQDQVIGTLRSMRGLRPADENDFALLQSDQLVDLFNRLTGMFFIVMLALSSVGLMVGGVGVIGIMLISVTERTREIGIRKSVGATRKEILWQFLVEAGVLTLLGGAAGLLVGGVAAEVLAAYTPLPARIPFWSVVVALLMALVTGVLFGLLPAIRASRMEPVTALGFE